MYNDTVQALVQALLQEAVAQRNAEVMTKENVQDIAYYLTRLKGVFLGPDEEDDRNLLEEI